MVINSDIAGGKTIAHYNYSFYLISFIITLSLFLAAYALKKRCKILLHASSIPVKLSY
jgi:hypothetical protein